jgi:hypothetical protein
MESPGPSLEDQYGIAGARAGFLALGSSYSPRLPSPTGPVALWVSFPITVTGSRRLATAFPAPLSRLPSAYDGQTVACAPLGRKAGLACLRYPERRDLRIHWRPLGFPDPLPLGCLAGGRTPRAAATLAALL